MARKRAHKRRTYGLQPERDKGDNSMLERCIEFVKKHQSLALDDSYDRDQLAVDLVEFVSSENAIALEEIEKWAFNTNR